VRTDATTLPKQIAERAISTSGSLAYWRLSAALLASLRCAHEFAPAMERMPSTLLSSGVETDLPRARSRGQPLDGAPSRAALSRLGHRVERGERAGGADAERQSIKSSVRTSLAGMKTSAGSSSSVKSTVIG